MGFETDNLPLFENSSDAIIVLQDGIMRNMNTNAMRVLRYEAHDLVNHPYGDFVHPDDVALMDEQYTKRIKHAFGGGEVCHLESRLRAPPVEQRTTAPASPKTSTTASPQDLWSRRGRA